MSDKTLKNIIQLFLMISKINSKANSQIIRIFIKKYLSYFLNYRFVENYIDYYEELSNKSSNKYLKPNSTTFKIVLITNELRLNLDKYHRILLIINLIEFINYYEPLIFFHKDKKQIIYDAICTIAEIFLIPLEVIENIYQFILGNFYDKNIRNEILIIEKNKNKTFKNIVRAELNVKIYILFIKKLQIYVLSQKGMDSLFLNDKELRSNYLYIFNQGDVIKNDVIKPIFYSQVEYCFFESGVAKEFEFYAKNLSFSYPKSKAGLKDFSFINNNNELVGIIGSSGSGKTTLLNLLCGKLVPETGEILFNGQNINNSPDYNKLIGYIAQDDILIEELTIYQNLYYNCKLVYADKTKNEINEIIDKILNEFELSDVKNNKVGNIFSKKISGGQRKRVNLAMEYIRETLIMFIDEPTSGLSSSDSLNIMKLQKNQATNGKLIFVNIHQPSSDILKLFDKVIIIDKEGYIAFVGNPVEAISYFKVVGDFVDISSYECDCCQSLNPGKILKIIESKKINEEGDYISDRKLTPKEWNLKYKENIESKLQTKSENINTNISGVKFSNPVQQFFTYLNRGLATKISDFQYIFILLSEVPILAFILSILSKNFSFSGNNMFVYNLKENENLPAFIFMSIVVALFYGLSISSEEIFRDRKILERERFLKLNRHSYLLSKVFFHFINSAIQMFIFMIISIKILQIEDFGLKFWLILFSVSFCSNLLGLNISDGLKNIVSIYIIIPLILIPQLLLSGVIIKFDKLHKTFNSDEYVPVIADFMISRWAYEALMIEQFKSNDFNSLFFELNKEISNKTYLAFYYIPNLEQEIAKFSDEKTLDQKTLIINEIKKLGNYNSYFSIFLNIDLNDSLSLTKLNSSLVKYTKLINKQIDSLNIELENQLNIIGGESILVLKEKYTNDKVNDQVLNSLEFRKTIIRNNSIYRKFEPIYQIPYNKIGRTQLFVAEKLVGNFLIQTFYFNFIVIWIFSLFLYFALYFRLLHKLLNSVKRRL